MSKDEGLTWQLYVHQICIFVCTRHKMQFHAQKIRTGYITQICLNFFNSRLWTLEIKLERICQ
jgi:hypothetical protein